jgi:hypothetical protein
VDPLGIAGFRKEIPISGKKETNCLIYVLKLNYRWARTWKFL